MSFPTRVAAILSWIALSAFWFGVRAQDSSRSVWDGIYTAEQASQGQTDYNQHCASCHAENLAGADEAPPLSGGAFISNWNGLTVGDLFERIRTTMPLDNPPKVNRETKARVLAYILSFNRFPSGVAALPDRTEALKLIRFEAERPKK